MHKAFGYFFYSGFDSILYFDTMHVIFVLIIGVDTFGKTIQAILCDTAGRRFRMEHNGFPWGDPDPWHYSVFIGDMIALVLNAVTWIRNGFTSWKGRIL